MSLHAFVLLYIRAWRRTLLNFLNVVSISVSHRLVVRWNCAHDGNFVAGVLIFVQIGNYVPGMWVGLTDESSSTSNWEVEVKNYQYWNTTDEDGEFAIYSVRPGRYILHTVVHGFLVDSSVLQDGLDGQGELGVQCGR